SIMIQIVADHKIPFLKGALEGVASVKYLSGGEISRSDLLEADALIIRTRTRCDRSLLEGTGVKFIATATIGHDHIDREYCSEAAISWVNAPGCNASSVQQYMVSTLLYLAVERNLELSSLTLGVIGVGNVGSKVVKAAESLGMKVLMNDPPRERSEGSGPFVPLEHLLAQSDVVTLHVPLNRGGADNTLQMVNRQFIQQMKPGAILVNSSRGGVVSEQHLISGIESGKISGAVLDVFQGEPEVGAGLLDLLTLATPHIAGYSLDGKANGTTMAVQAVSQFFNLGLDGWEPDGIPLPEQTMLLGDASSFSRNELLWELFRQTYDVSKDDRRLRDQPEAFESLRGNYPLRREPPAFSVRLFQGYPEIRELLEALGFSVLSDHCS
ncbi:MAG: 4-phosphoerythronate dehydrogenase, partial [Bacteroidota bacterium]